MTASDRRALLRRRFTEQPGPIRTGQVCKFYLAQGLEPCRTTARADLKTLERLGLIYATGPTDDRRWWLRAIGGAR
ncbi:hypothetical protein AB0469_31645 [Streptomyces sp. NPDC093801]|uniref:hypothetical protein n=1 Tax=Streptomyces sp. NPDC093801 TaxID=3155203 RepID=UPI00344D110C